MSICSISHHYNCAKTKVHYNLQHVNPVKSKVRGWGPRSAPAARTFCIEFSLVSNQGMVRIYIYILLSHKHANEPRM